MPKAGSDYETFVQDVFQAIINADVGQKNIEVKKNVKLRGNSGLEREFDVYWEYELAGILYKTVIECKDYNSAITIEKIDALTGKIQDFPGMRGLFATKVGYQSGAKTYAEDRKIDAMIVRPLDPIKDFTTKDGEPLIREIHVHFEFETPPTPTSIAFVIDKKYLIESGFSDAEINDIEKSRYLSDPSKVIFEDLDSGNSYLLINILEDLQQNPPNKEYGEHELSISYANTFVTYEDGRRIKIEGIKILYINSRPTTHELKIDAMEAYMAVIEYLSNGSKKMIGNDGISRESNV